MSDPFIGEIKIVSWNFAPRGWALCNGQTMAISQNQALFSILGTTYGGDGIRSFALPDFRGRTAVHAGGNYPIGSIAGEEFHALTSNEMPLHNHLVQASTDTADTVFIQAVQPPSQNVFGTTASAIYGGASSLIKMNAAGMSTTGSGQAHENRQPALVLNFIIALQGIFPSRN